MSGDVPGSARGHTAKARAASFGAEAALYDSVRPGYPDSLAAALGASSGSAVLDIGCGTGKSSLPFLRAGCEVLGIEPDEKMAERGRAAGLKVEVGHFEQWESVGARFDLVVSGQAWHWLDPDIAPRRAAALLRPGGRLAPFWNYRHPEPTALDILRPLYAELAPALLQNSPLLGSVDIAEELDRYATAITRTGSFADVQQRAIGWETSYDAEQWIALTRTQSDHRLLDPAALELLLDHVRAALGDRRVGVHYDTIALVAPLA